MARGGPDGIRRLHEFAYPHSLGLFYAQVTGALGFRMSRHEGKVVGLAAHGDPDLLYEEVRGRFEVRDGDFRYLHAMDDGPVKRWAREHRREDVAAVWQRVLEDVVAEVAGHWVAREGLSDLVLAGGVAANVKMNQRIFELEGVRRIYVHPAMGDDGTGTGAALQVAAEAGTLDRDFRLEHVFLGPSFDDAAIHSAIDRAGLDAERPEDLADRVAECIAAGKVVARFAGGMEYGPRALGNRSILYHCQDPSVNDWLNQRLRRTEFMPFAPAALADDGPRLFRNLEGAELAAEFMTITFDGTDEFLRIAPAAAHVDGTARPQLVRPEINPGFHAILSAYRDRTGLPAIINTLVQHARGAHRLPAGGRDPGLRLGGPRSSGDRALPAHAA